MKTGEDIRDLNGASIVTEQITELNISNDSLNSDGEIVFCAQRLVNNVCNSSVIVAQPHFSPRFLSGSTTDSLIAENIRPGHPASQAELSPQNIVIHATAGREPSDLQSLTYSTSTGIHYLVSQQGRVTQVIQEKFKANHASSPAMNSRSIGIELTDNNSHLKNPNWLTEYRSTAGGPSRPRHRTPQQHSVSASRRGQRCKRR